MLQICYTEKLEGPVPGQKIVTVETAGGHPEEIIVDESLLINGSLRVAVVARREKEMLVELPVESASGKWRLWVDESKVHK